MNAHVYLLTAFMRSSAVSVMQICCSMSQAATCDMCRSNLVIYTCESPVDALRAAHHTVPWHTRTAWGRWDPAACSRVGGQSTAGGCPSLKAQNRGVKERAYLAWHWFMGCNVLLLHTKHRVQAGVEIRGGEAILCCLSPWESAGPVRMRDKELSANTCFSVFPLCLLHCCHNHKRSSPYINTIH